MGEVASQMGHNKECKVRIMDLMEKDKGDKHRVKNWYIARGIDEEKAQQPPEGVGEGTEANMDCDAPPPQPQQQQSSSSSSSNGHKQRRNDRQETREPETRKAKTENQNGVSDQPHKKKRLGCINFIGEQGQHKNEEKNLKQRYADQDALFIITGGAQPRNTRNDLHRQQHENMKYFIDIDARHGTIVSNSAGMLAVLKMTKAVAASNATDDGYTRIRVDPKVRPELMELIINKGMELQRSIDDSKLFICSVDSGAVTDDELNEAQAGEGKCHEAPAEDEGGIAWDDVNNCELNYKMVQEARKAEMDYFRKMQVYKKVPIRRCKDMTGKMPIKVRWIDTNKQDEANPKYRSRLVAKDFKKFNDPELYTATPPIEMLRCLISIAATGWGRTGRRRKIMVNDVARAYFNAPNLTPVFVDICDEDREPGDEQMCGELLVSMYGTRPAASNWQKCYTQLLLDHGFRRTRASTCMFRHAERDIDLLVHGDDFFNTGEGEDLVWLKGVLESKFEISTNIIGEDDGDENQVKVLNRIITIGTTGYTYEPDARHAELIVREMGLLEAKALATPVADEVNEGDELLDHERFKRYQSICARANFLAIDRFDLQFAAKECCRAMSRPTCKDWAKLKRIGRYLIGRPRLVYHYKFQEDVKMITTFSDANWASDKIDRKSTSGGLILHGSHYIKSWSKTQSLVALSSAESELYAIVKASSEALGLRSILQDMGKEFANVILSDASAALGIIQRQGLGKLRHVDCSFLFVQNLNANKTFQFAKVPGLENPADLGTKGLPWERIWTHCTTASAEFCEGRPDGCPALMTLSFNRPVHKSGIVRAGVRKI